MFRRTLAIEKHTTHLYKMYLKTYYRPYHFRVEHPKNKYVYVHNIYYYYIQLYNNHFVQQMYDKHTTQSKLLGCTANIQQTDSGD